MSLRPAKLLQFKRWDVKGGGVEQECPQVRRRGLLSLALKLQNPAQLEVRIGATRIVGDRGSVRSFRFGQTPGFFQHVAVLNPYRRVPRPTLQGLSVIPGCTLPSSLVARPIGESDNTEFCTFLAKSRHQLPLVSNTIVAAARFEVSPSIWRAVSESVRVHDDPHAKAQKLQHRGQPCDVSQGPGGHCGLALQRGERSPSNVSSGGEF